MLKRFVPRIIPRPRTCPSFHSAAVLQVARHQAQAIRKKNIQHTEERLRKSSENQPSVVLGTRPHEEATAWPNCDLAKCLVDVSKLGSNTSPSPAESIEVTDLGMAFQVPKEMNYGVGDVEKKMLFEELPVLSAQAPFQAAMSDFSLDAPTPPMSPQVLQERQASAVNKEAEKVQAFAKVLDLRNANAGGIAYENRRRIILTFSSPENPYDPGRTEVQAALLTYQIRNLWTHLTTYKRDVGNRRGLRKLVHQRAKVLRYLKQKDQDRYEALLPRLALDPQSVEGELVV